MESLHLRREGFLSKKQKNEKGSTVALVAKNSPFAFALEGPQQRIIPFLFSK